VDLPQVVANELGIDTAHARRGLSAVFMSMRMALDQATFGQVRKAFPGSDAWMREIELEQPRTGEILALASPKALRRQLKLAGFTEKDISRLGPTVGQALQAALSPEAFDHVVARVPLLKGAL
jgi:uncharacterized protein (DUF2267 family)